MPGLGHDYTLASAQAKGVKPCWFNARTNHQPYQRWERAFIEGYANPEMLKARDDS